MTTPPRGEAVRSRRERRHDLEANRGLVLHTCTWRSVDVVMLARFNKAKGEAGIPSRLRPDAVVMWLPDMLRPTEALIIKPKGPGILWLRLVFSGEEAEVLKV